MPRVGRRTRHKITAAREKAKSLASAIASANATTLSNTPPETPTLLFKDAAAWGLWLEENHQADKVGVVWLKIGKKGCVTPTVTYEESVETALCFGWIDGQRKALDEQFFIQRFTPRRKKSIWSKRNVARVKALSAAGRMRPSGQAEVDAAQADGRWDKAY